MVLIFFYCCTLIITFFFSLIFTEGWKELSNIIYALQVGVFTLCYTIYFMTCLKKELPLLTHEEKVLFNNFLYIIKILTLTLVLYFIIYWLFLVIYDLYGPWDFIEKLLNFKKQLLTVDHLTIDYEIEIHFKKKDGWISYLLLPSVVLKLIFHFF
jgi:hypothetical protein